MSEMPTRRMTPLLDHPVLDNFSAGPHMPSEMSRLQPTQHSLSKTLAVVVANAVFSGRYWIV
jgi:hypothetical protein